MLKRLLGKHHNAGSRVAVRVSRCIRHHAGAAVAPGTLDVPSDEPTGGEDPMDAACSQTAPGCAEASLTKKR